jgi:hypothetical protein
MEIKNDDQDVMVSSADFSSDINDVLIPQESPSNGKVQSIQMPISQPTSSKKRNPFNLSDEQITAVIAGAVGAIVHLPMVQAKIPQVNGDIQKGLLNVLLIAVLFFFAIRFYKNR